MRYLLFFLSAPPPRDLGGVSIQETGGRRSIKMPELPARVSKAKMRPGRRLVWGPQRLSVAASRSCLRLWR